MKYDIILTESAYFDLENIHNYIALDNPLRAKTYIDEIKLKIAHLADFPLMGEANSLHNRDERFLIYDKYKIYYSINENKNEIEIKHIRHGSMKPLKQ
jgi:toxin ParE1/3/4